MFLIFIAITVGITYWASKRSAGSSAYFAASRRVTGWQNGIAVAGDYMSAASFLGIAGIIAFQGYDGFMFSVGWLVTISHGSASRRRTAAQRRPLHHGGCARVPTQSTPCPCHGFH